MLTLICIDDRDIDTMLVKACGLWDFLKARLCKRTQAFDPPEHLTPMSL
jgi:hypothetical protein